MLISKLNCIPISTISHGWKCAYVRQPLKSTIEIPLKPWAAL